MLPISGKYCDTAAAWPLLLVVLTDLAKLWPFAACQAHVKIMQLRPIQNKKYENDSLPLQTERHI